jgi:AcrR family transcriptional regulator
METTEEIVTWREGETTTDRQQRRASRRQRRAERRRSQILRAAIRVFEAKGYERATTKEIAEEADVSEGVLYYYFESKRDLLLQLVQAYNETVIAEMEELKTAGDIRSFVRNVLLKRFSDIDEQRQFFNAVMYEIQIDPCLWHEHHETVQFDLITHIEKYLNVAVEEGLFRPLHTGIVARAIIAMVKGLVTFRLADSSVLADVSTEDFVDEIVSLLLDGLRLRGEGQPVHSGDSTKGGLTKEREPSTIIEAADRPVGKPRDV